MLAHEQKNFYLSKAAFFADGGDNQSGYMAPQLDCPLILPLCWGIAAEAEAVRPFCQSSSPAV